jgi:hypothetical protein
MRARLCRGLFVQSGSAWRWQDTRAAPTSPAGYHPSTSTTPMRSCTLWAGTHKVRSFAKGQGRGWPWSKTPSCRRLRPGGAYGKRCYKAPTEQLNITSRCITRSLQHVGTGLNGQRLDAVQAKHLPSREELYNVALCYDANPGTDGDSKHQRSPGVIAPPLGGWEGLNPHG